MIYCYFTARGIASLHKIQNDGSDIDQKPVKLGRFASEEEARQACIQHYNKACRLAENSNRDVPAILWL